jgi:mannosyl-oligosaccharide alpha-1,2-mannosidase
VEHKREKVKQMMMHAWDSYAKYAWGANELRPVSKQPHSGSVFGGSKLGASIVDGMDTLYIMGLFDRFDKARKWVETSFSIKSVTGDLSVFETNIRFVGGFLACYALTKDPLFMQKAEEVANTLLPAFNTPTGIPYALISMRTKNSHNWGWASGGSSILSEFGTLSLEFEYLSAITGKPIYAKKVKRIMDFLDMMEKPNGLYPNYLNPKTGKWGSRHTSVGALGDSFYEYLLKNWLITNRRDARSKRMYDAAIKAMEEKLLEKSKKHGLYFFNEMRGNRLDAKMDHLACFSAGMFALQSANEVNASAKQHYLNLGKEIGRTCHESYIQADTHLGPEAFRFTNEFEAKSVNSREKHYIQRPEVVEGWFYLWRVTKEQKYRDWCWDAVLAIEKYCRTDGGYAGIRNVYDVDTAKDDVQQSYFLAETLKYLYLVFTPDDVMPLDRWVFNTEAHALPVRMGRDSDYRHSTGAPDAVQADNGAGAGDLVGSRTGSEGIGGVKKNVGDDWRRR